MRRSYAVLLFFIACAPFALAGDNPSQPASSAPPPPISYSNCAPGGQGIPCTFWGIHVNQLGSYPLQVPYGQFRGWDGANANWPAIAATCNPSSPPTDPCFAWTNLDQELTNVKQAGVNNVFYTLSRTPPWAVTQQQESDSHCDDYTEYPGACYPPVDLNWDGTGTDQIWRNWVAAIALHVNQQNYAGAHIQYWEIWNQFYRSPTLDNSPPPWSFGGTYDQSTEGSYDQLVRMAEDANCIITGRVTNIIENNGESCSTVLSTVGLTAPIDPNAAIVSPSTSAPAATTVLQNFLYCNNSPKTSCAYGNAGFNAVDIINVHFYATDSVQTPEYVASTQIPVAFSIAGGKPVWNGEGSWGNTTTQGDVWQDPYAQAGFIPRFFALYWSAGLTGNFWYGYDFPDDGQLFDPTSGLLLQPEGNAWILTYNWLSHAVPLNDPFCQANGTIYSCDFTEATTYTASGRKARLVWDSQYGQNCSEMQVPIICGDTPYVVPSQFNRDWIDLSGAVHYLPNATNTVTIGANPILLEGQ